MDALPNTTGAANVNSGPSTVLPAPLPPLPPKLTRRQESYARCVASGMSYAEAFRQGGLLASTAGSMARQIGDLNRDPKIRNRINELKPRADAEAMSSVAERMAWLRLIINANPDELSRVVAVPCGACWTDAMLAEHMARHFAPPNPFAERPPMPDVRKPRGDCAGCLGGGIKHAVITPTDELSPEGRALFMGASQDKDGVIKIAMQDQQAAADMLNKLQSAYVTRSLNLNANVAVHAARDATPEQALALFDSFGAPT